MDLKYPLVGIVVLNFNGKKCLLSCLESLKKLRYPNFFVIIVDNNSTDDSFSLAERAFPRYSFIKNNENRGFSGGMNVGMKAAFDAGAEWAWLFNNDATAEPSALHTLVDVALREPQAGLLSPVIYTKEGGSLWFGKGSINNLRMRTVHLAPSVKETASVSYPSEFLTGCALLVSRTLFDHEGGLDESFFLYYEDADFSLRARKAGYKTLVVSGAKVFHSEQSQENSQKLYYLVLSGLIFFKKHASFLEKLYFFVYGTIRRLKNAIDVILGKKDAKTVRQAYRDFYYGSALLLNRNRQL